MGGTSGSVCERVMVVTPSARKSPVLMSRARWMEHLDQFRKPYPIARRRGGRLTARQAF